MPFFLKFEVSVMLTGSIRFDILNYILWILLGGDIILTAKDLEILLCILKPATSQWKTVGLALGFLDHELTIIEQTPLLIPEGLNGYFREMLGQWLRWAPPNHSFREVGMKDLQSKSHKSLCRRKVLTVAMYDSVSWKLKRVNLDYTQMYS